MIYLIIVSLIWAFSFGINKVYLSDLDSFFVATMRLALALLIFAPFFRLNGLSRANLIRLVILGSIQYGLMYQAYTYCFSILKAYEAALFTIFTPLYIVAFNDVVQKRWSPRTLLCALVAVVGAGIIQYSPANPFQLWKAFLLMQLANTAFAMGQVYYKHWKMAHQELQPQTIFAAVYLGAFLFSLMVSGLLTDWSELSLKPSHYGALLYLGVGASGLGLFFWNIGATKTNTGTLAVLNNLVVPMAVVISLLFFKEATTLSQEAWLRFGSGTGLILLALIANEKWALRKL